MIKVIGPPIVKRAHLIHYTFSVPYPRQALARDGFRCVVTGSFDTRALASNLELDQKCSDLDGVSATVQACHILCGSTTQDIDPTWSDGIVTTTVENKVCSITIFSSPPSSPLPTPVAQTDSTPTGVAILKHFGLTSLADEFLTDGVHDLGNLLSLQSEIRNKFDRLDLWFESADKVRHS